VNPSAPLPSGLAVATNTIQLPRSGDRRPGSPHLWYLGPARWFFVLLAAALVALFSADWYRYDSPWVGVGLALTTAVMLHLGLVARQVPWIPGLVAFVACIQWVIAPWASYHMPPAFPIYQMAVTPDEYFSYAVPATLLLVAGLYLPSFSPRAPSGWRPPRAIPRDLARSCDILVVIGVAATAILTREVPAVLQYPLVLCGYLGFVGAFTLMLARADGWGWRVAVILGARIMLSSVDGVFHDVILWVAYASALAAFLYRLRGRWLAAAAIAAAVLLGALNEIKGQYRTQLEENPDLTVRSRTSVLGDILGEQLRQPTAVFSGDALGRIVVRINQGAIISHELEWVPAREPFAHGETVINAVRNVVVPRIWDPTKYVAGGYAYFRRFTGLPMARTSMNLGPTGEMYANFGRAGGLIATFFYALLIGLIYRVFARWALDSPLWWAWAPYVLLYSMQAENGLGEIVNHLAKSALLMGVIIWQMPAWQTLRRWRLRRVSTAMAAIARPALGSAPQGAPGAGSLASLQTAPDRAPRASHPS
jgi:hypothetical protein